MKKYDLVGKRVYVAGHRGMVGSAIVRRLQGVGCEVLMAGREEVDLCDQRQVREWMAARKPQAVFLAAAKVGGILANASRPAEFIYENLAIETNIIEAAHRVGVEKLLFLGSTCIYPKFADQPIREEALLGGDLEPTNQWYAVAKIAGIKLCQAFRAQYGDDFISAMPTNLYGPNDNFDLQSSHVLPALIRKAHEAKLSGSDLVLWGSGTPLREFMHVDDLADALVHIMANYSADIHINAGTGTDISIRDLATLICEIVGFTGKLTFDATKPDGTPRKCTDVTRLSNLGWAPKISLEEGIRQTYEWYVRHAVVA